MKFCRNTIADSYNAEIAQELSDGRVLGHSSTERFPSFISIGENLLTISRAFMNYTQVRA